MEYFYHATIYQNESSKLQLALLGSALECATSSVAYKEMFKNIDNGKVAELGKLL